MGVLGSLITMGSLSIKNLRKEGLKPNILDIKKQFNQRKENSLSLGCRRPTKMLINNLSLIFRLPLLNSLNTRRDTLDLRKKGLRTPFTSLTINLKVDENKFWIPKLGWVMGAESLRFSGKINSATIKRKANYWFIVISVLTEIEPKTCENQAVVGVDLGHKSIWLLYLMEI